MNFSFGYQGGGGGGGGLSNVPYANVAYVDKVNGNDGTAVSGSFTKPFLSVQAAINSVAAAASASTPMLVYLRQGTYNDSCVLSDNVYIYCEPSVIFLSGGFFDSSTSVTTGVYGYAQFMGSSIPIRIFYGTNATIEFDKCSTTNGSGFFYISPFTGYNPKITIKANELFSTGVGGYGCSVRGNANVQLIVSRKISSYYSVFSLRDGNGVAWQGTLDVICPNIAILDGGQYGNNASFKQVFISNNVMSGNPRLHVYGDIYSEVVGSLGSNSGCVVNWTGSNICNVVIEGNIYAGDIVAVKTYGTSKVNIVDGIISSNTTLFLSSDSSIISIEGSRLIKKTSLASNPFLIYATSTLYLDFSSINSEYVDGDIILTPSGTPYLYITNTNSQASTSLGTGKFINNPSALTNVGLINVFANQDINIPSITNLYTSLGFTKEINLKTPNFI